jgi:hypothetical protein
VAPIIAHSPGGVHTASLFDMAVSAGLWSHAQGFAVFDHSHPCFSLRVSHSRGPTQGRYENIQEIQIRPVKQQDTTWCAYEILVLASQDGGDCSDVLVSEKQFALPHRNSIPY